MNALSLASRLQRASHRARVADRLRELGLSKVALGSMSARYLPRLIHPTEEIGGAVYGQYAFGFAILVATDQRVVFLDKKPLFVNKDEITYDVVSGVSYSHAGLGSTITLHTRIKDYTIYTLNERSVEPFVSYIESHCLERPMQRNYYD